MPTVPYNSINTTALIVPDIYVQIVPPQNLVLNGVPTSTTGMVGTASWGPVNSPVIVGTMQDYARSFGPIVARKFDMGTHVACAVQQGAADFRCVRVSDGTDAKATISGPTGCITLTALHTGSLGNSITVRISAGSKSGTFRAVVGLPGLQPEVFDNVAGAGNDFWANLATVINTGSGFSRGPSQLITAAAGAGTTAPSVATYTLAAGTDGAGISASALVGTDAATRTGMYALRGQRVSIMDLVDCDDVTQWPAATAFGVSEGVYVVLAGVAGQTIASAISTKASAGVDSPAAKVLFGDHLFWRDSVNGVVRMVSPAGFVAGRLANLSPEQSSLNKDLFGIVGSQKNGLPGSGQTLSYSAAEIQALLEAGIDLVTNPIPAGNRWGVRGGHNSSSNPAANGDNYTRMTNYLGSTLSGGMGLYVGQLVNSTLFQRIRSTLLAFLTGMVQQRMLGSTDGSLPFSVQCDIRNNPASRTSLGYVQADVQVQYQAINEKFIVNMEGGQTVSVNRQTLPNFQS